MNFNLLIGFAQLSDQLVFDGMPERMTFPLGGRWHGEAVTDEGKRGDFLGDNDKRGKLPTWYSCFPRRNPSVRQPLIRPSVRTGAPSPEGEGLGVQPSSLQIPICREALGSGIPTFPNHPRRGYRI